MNYFKVGLFSSVFIACGLSLYQAQAAPLWYHIQPLPQANLLFSIDCAANACVAVGGSGASMNIRANASMVIGEPYSAAILYRVMHDDTDFLAFQLGSFTDPYSYVLTSKNGYRWASTGGKLYRGAGRFVLPNKGVWAGSQYIVGGASVKLTPYTTTPFLARSVDKLTWTYITPPGTSYGRVNDVAANSAGSTIVAAGDFRGVVSNVYVSTDSGANWAYQTTPTTTSLNGVVWDAPNSQFVVVGSSGTILTSPDGLTWTDRSLGTTTFLKGIASNDAGLLVAIASNSTLYSNDAGVTWSNGLNTGAEQYSIAWNGSQMIAVGNQGDVRASYDGFLWFEWDYVEANPPTYYDVAFDGVNTVVTAGSRGRLDYSTDSGGMWVKSPSTPVLTETYNAIEWVKNIGGVGINKFVAVGSAVAKTSSAGTFWRTATTPPTGTISDLAFNNPVAGSVNLVGVGFNTAYTSRNGSVWTSHPTAFANTVYGVAGEGKLPYRFVAVGANNSVYSSADAGVTWAAQPSPITLAVGESLQFNDVFWTTKYRQNIFSRNGIFLAVGTKTLASGDVEGVVVVSYNGTLWYNWTNYIPITARQNKEFLAINGSATDIFIVGRRKNVLDSAGMIIENTVRNFRIWQEVLLPATPTLRALVPTTAGGAIAVGDTSLIISKLNDVTPPSQIVAPAGLTIEAADATPIALLDNRVQSWLGQFYATDNRDITILDIQNNAPASFAPNTVNPITFTVSDRAGNAIITPLIRNITVQDLQSPVVFAPTNITVPSVAGVLGVTNTNPAVVAFLAGATATDNVDGVINPVNISNDAPTLFPIGTTTVTFSATDSGMPANTGTASASVTVWDAQAPTINLPVPAHYEIAATSALAVPLSDPYVQQYIGLVTAFDNWDPGALTVSNDAPATFPVGTQVFIDFYATDAYGNVGHNPLNSASITVKDFTAPVITPPTNITIPSDSGLGVFNSNAAITTFLAGATATDNVDGVIASANISNDAPQVFAIGTTQVTFFVDDGQGNRGFASANVTVWDAQAPIVYLPTPVDIVLSADTAAGLPLTDPYVQQYINAVIALDDYEGSRTVSNDAPATFALNQQVNITFTATDTYGNTGTAVGSVTAIDDTPPMLTAPADISVLATSALGTDVGNALIQAFLNAANATDNVDGTISVFNDAPTVFPIGTTKVTFFADDASGNRSLGSASVEVTAGSGGTPDAASCLIGSSQPTYWPWLSLGLLVMGAGFKRKRD